MKMNFILKISALLMIGILAYSCGDDDTEVDPCEGLTATYNGEVQAIINSSCAFFGCHNGSNGNIAEASRDFTTFEGMASVTTNGEFNSRVLVIKDMPIAPAQLTDAQLQILQCWHDDGYPEG